MLPQERASLYPNGHRSICCGGKRYEEDDVPDSFWWFSAKQTRPVSAFFNSADEEYRVLLPWAVGTIWCPNKFSKTLKTALGLVVIVHQQLACWPPAGIPAGVKMGELRRNHRFSEALVADRCTAR
jgi:hypothetical protein